jgi:hypothetical protein
MGTARRYQTMADRMGNDPAVTQRARQNAARQPERAMADMLGSGGMGAQFANTGADGQALELINGELPRITLG